MSRTAASLAILAAFLIVIAPASASAQCTTLANAVNYSTVNKVYPNLAVGDVNEDSILDIVGPSENGTFAILIGNGDGTFAPALN